MGYFSCVVYRAVWANQRAVSTAILDLIEDLKLHQEKWNKSKKIKNLSEKNWIFRIFRWNAGLKHLTQFKHREDIPFETNHKIHFIHKLSRSLAQAVRFLKSLCVESSLGTTTNILCSSNRSRTRTQSTWL